jgi:hypothetical protein
MTAVGYISDSEDIVNSSQTNLQYHGAAAFKFLARSPLQPAVSAMDLLGGRTQKFNVYQINNIDRHPVESDKESAPASISNTKNCLHLNGDLDNPNVSKVDWEENDESDLQQENHIEDQETLAQ